MPATPPKSIFRGPDQPDLLHWCIGDLFAATVNRYPDRDALIIPHQRIRWSYRRYGQQVDAFAAALQALGIGKGDRIGIWAPNCYEWCVVQFASAQIGAIMVCINPAYRLHELGYALNKSGCQAIVVAERFKGSRYLEMLQTLAPELTACAPGSLQAAQLPHLRIVIRLGEEPTPGMYNFPKLCAEAAAPTAVDLDPNEAINIQFTSGTTGNPKGATLTHGNILNNGAMVGAAMRLTPADRVCVPVPLYHCFGMVMGNLACVAHGAAVILPGESFEPLATLTAVERERCTALYGVPTMFIAELERPDFSGFDLRSLRTGIMAGAPCPMDVMNRVMHEMHMHEVLIAYGQTETSPVNHMTTADDPVEKRVNSVGRPGPHLEIKLIDKKGGITAIGEPGEICCRGYAVMQSYWEDPEQTAATIDSEGWLHSGDVGVADENGYLQIVGRIKDMIIRGGENIYPRELEEFLHGHPDILDVQVFGVPDSRLGEVVCAWIILKAGANLSADDVRSYCKEQIAHFKIPAHIRMVPAFPLTVTGKAQKFRMREAMVEELQAP